MTILKLNESKICLFILFFVIKGFYNCNVYSQSIDISEATLGYPAPAIPFYHFKIKVELPYQSAIRVTTKVDGKELRFTDIYSDATFKKIELNNPRLVHRPPSAYALSEDTTKYKAFYAIGWLRWKPGHRYNLEVKVQLKDNLQFSEHDTTLSAIKILTAPLKSVVFDSAWENYKAVVVSETNGIARVGAPIELLLPFYPDEANNIENDIRVVSVDPKTFALSEVSSQVYDVKKFLMKDDLSPLQKGDSDRIVPLWLPTVTAQLSFLADVPAHSSEVFLIFYNNKNAKRRNYQTDLHIQESVGTGMQISNNSITVELHPKSKVLNRISLNSHPNEPLYNDAETNGAIQWNPDVYSPPRPWAHTSDWEAPHSEIVKGPVMVAMHIWDNLPHYPEVIASVTNKFYANKPYFISSTAMRIEDALDVLALRNGEMVLKRNLITHVAWYDVIRDSAIIYDLKDLPTLTDLEMTSDVPWITFYNEQTGIGFAGIQLDHLNSGIESSLRVLNPYVYVTLGPWVYWARALSLSYISANHQQMIPALKGNIFSEKWAYLVYEVDKNRNGNFFSPVIKLRRELTNPLKIQLVEEVDRRVSESIVEIMSNGASPWDR